MEGMMTTDAVVVTLIPPTALTADELTNVALSAIIAKAAAIARNYPEMDKWKDVYEPAKAVIADFNLAPGEYERAIQMLTEALNI
jgi:hypothetical protein